MQFDAPPMQVKAQALLNAATWISERYGEATLARVLERCPPAVRERRASAIAIEWHPLSELTDFLEAAESLLGERRGVVSTAVGAASARKNTQGMVKRALFYLATPRFLLQRMTSMWSQFNSQGSLKLAHLDRQHALIELTGIPEPHDLFCATLTGWTEVVAEAVGGMRPTSIHEACRARGDDRCVWRILWTGTKDEYRPSESEGSKGPGP